jgi:hypothetical protein
VRRADVSDQPTKGPLPDVLAALVVGPHDHLVLSFGHLDHAALQAVRAALEQHTDLADRVLVVDQADMAVIRAHPTAKLPNQRNGHTGPTG